MILLCSSLIKWSMLRRHNRLVCVHATDDNMAHAHCMLDTLGYRNTLRIRIVFPLQQLLHESALSLPCTYIECLPYFSLSILTFSRSESCLSVQHININRTLYITCHGNNYVSINFSGNLRIILMSTNVYLSWRFSLCILICPLASYVVESGLPVLFVLPRRSVYMYVWRSIDAGGMRSPVWTGIRGNDAAKRKQIKVWEIAHGIGVFSRLYIVQTPLHTFIHTSHVL
jgi:hypothetical protein